MKNLGCGIMILPAVTFILFMVKYDDISPVAGTTMWIVFFLGLWINSIGRKEEEKEKEDQKADPFASKIPVAELKPIQITSPKPATTPESEFIPQTKPPTPPEPHQVRFNYVNYTSSLPDQIDVFPIFRFPQKGCIVRKHSHGRINRRGYKEQDFQTAIEECFGNEFLISGEIILNTGRKTRPYEPDIALIDRSNPSLKIDIEIDEPYAAFTRKPTHCIGDDTQRDIYFTDRGWIVLRFTEHQVHTSENQCLRYLASIIQSVKPSFRIPPQLEAYEAVGNEKLWDLVTAQKWERAKRREEYLGIESFGNQFEEANVIVNDFGEQDEIEETKVNPTPIGTREAPRATQLNRSSSRDGRIEFYPENHVYTIDGVQAPSVSTVIDKFFPEFDIKYWARKKAIDKIIAENLEMSESNIQRIAAEIEAAWIENGRIQAQLGTVLHEQIEKFYLGIDYTRTEEFHLFEQFHSDHLHIQQYRSEWRIFDEDHHIAGTIDMVAKNGNQFEIYDWKRSKKVLNAMGEVVLTNRYQRGIGFLERLDDTKFNRYCLQQSLYRHILESKYNLNISNMYLVVLHPIYDRYYKINVPYMQAEAMAMLNALHSN